VIATSLCQSAGRYPPSPWDLEAEIVALRHQLNVLRRKSPKRLAFSKFDRLIFAGLYRIAPGVTCLGDHAAGD
jgi:hypothetical protein